jgi:hypothetical protein
MYDCPRCKNEVNLMPWEDYHCPVCGLGGYWEEDFSEDYSESYEYFIWDNFESAGMTKEKADE